MLRSPGPCRVIQRLASIEHRVAQTGGNGHVSAANLYVKCCATGSLSKKKLITRCDPTTPWPPRRLAENLDGVGSASRKPAFAAGQPPPTHPDDRWSSRSPQRAP